MLSHEDLREKRDVMDQHHEAHRRAVEAQQDANREQQSRLQHLNDDWDRQARAAGNAGSSGEASTADRAQLAIGVVVLVLLVMGALLAWSELGGADDPSRSATAGSREVGAGSSPARGGGATTTSNSGGTARTPNGDAGDPPPAAPATPDYVGKLRGEAAAELQARGHAVTVLYRDGTPACTDPEAAEETVFGQAPATGEPLAPGAPVTLTVRRFSGANVAAPDLVGLTVDDARTVVTNLELTLDFDTPIQTGTVQWQSKTPCTRLARGTDVLIVRAG